MKISINRSISGLFLAVVGLLNFTSCSEDYPGNIESDKYTDLTAVRIVNAGPDGNVILEGDIDEMKKTITFPRIDTLSDLLNLTLEAETSEGASLEKYVFSVPYKKGETEKEIFIKVVNAPRFKEYKAIIGYDVPLFGANIETARYYDYSANLLGNPVYSSFVSPGHTRGSGFDGEHVLVVDRTGPAGVHLLNVAKLKNNEIVPIPLNMEGVSGGTFAVNMGAQAHGHTYVASLSNPLKLYHWSSPTSVPDVVANIDINTLTGLTHRHGDALSVNINRNGNGYAYFMSQGNVAVGGPIIRVKITNFNQGSDVTVITTKNSFEQWGHFTQVMNSDDFIISGHSRSLALVNNAGAESYVLGEFTLPRSITDIKIFEFNNQRYLLGVTAPRNAPTTGADILLYNISAGESIVDALTALDQKAVGGNNAPEIFKYNIVGGTNLNPGTQAGYHILKDASGNDSKLTIYGATFGGGFAMIEFDAYEIL